MSHGISAGPLGQQTQYVSVYSPELLFPIPRAASRTTLQLDSGNLPFYGVDIWTGYELSWLDERGKPVVALAEFRIPCTSAAIVESKSFKLYLNSFNQSRFEDAAAVCAILKKDLSAVVGAEVAVSLQRIMSADSFAVSALKGVCLDDLPVTINTYHPEPDLLAVHSQSRVEETLVSHLLKSNCPVTGQPDWASVQIDYAGAQIDHEGLLRYIVSFREHQDFHEHCVERMFVDIMARCQPERLSVYARYTRRGGLDINPFRTTEPDGQPVAVRLVRQ
jgi:7-cyano-7-deazaguanine reductase